MYAESVSTPGTKATTTVTSRKVHTKKTRALSKDKKAKDKPKKSVKESVLSQEEMSVLIIENMELGQKLAWKLLSSWNARLPEDDVRSLVGISLCEAARNFDARPGVKFPTFLFYYLRGRLLREISKNVKYQQITTKIQEEASADGNFHILLNDAEVNIPAPYESKNPERIMINREQDVLLDKALDALDPLERDVVLRYYSQGQAILTIAEELDYCRCHLSRVKTRAINKLKKAVKLQHSAATQGYGHLTPDEMIETVFQGYSGGRGRRKSGQHDFDKTESTRLAA